MDTELAEIGQELKNFTRDFDAKTGDQLKELSDRLTGIEQKLTAPRGYSGGDSQDSIGSILAESSGFKALQSGQTRSGQIKIGSFHKTTIVNATGQNQPLVPDMRVPGILEPARQRLTVRDLVPNLKTSSNLIQFARESSSTNNAGPQGDEGTVKGQSDLDFALLNAPVETLAHWVATSRQILEDATALRQYIDSRLIYMLKLAEEDQLLNGSGASHNISGLIANSTPMDTSEYSSDDTYVDTLGRAMEQVEDSNYEPDAFIMHPRDVWILMLTKTSGSGADGRYLFSNPFDVVRSPRVWGLPIVSTKSIARGQFMCGAFRLAATIWDRDDATVEVSREHEDFFTRNLVAILCEERLALTVYRSDALIYGGFPFGS